MSEFPELQEEDILAWTGKRSFERGQADFLQGAILAPSRQGTILKATCKESSEIDYQLHVELGPAGIQAAHCSCPAGAEGRCRHVAALLLAWLDDPDSFVESVRLNVSAVVGEERPADPEAIRIWAEQAILKNQEGLGDPLEIAANLQPILDLGKRYEQQGSYQNAAIVFRTLALTVLDYDLILLKDEEGYLHGIVWQCVSSLGRCLDSISDSADRRQILEALFDIYTWDLNSGSLGVASGVPDILQQQAQREERELICQWIQGQLPEGDAWQERYLRHVWGTLWLDLGLEWLDEKTTLQICRQTGLVETLVDRLIQDGRMEEAYQEARQSSDGELLSIADLFTAHGETALARMLVSERAQAREDSRFTEWLHNHSEGD